MSRQGVINRIAAGLKKGVPKRPPALATDQRRGGGMSRTAIRRIASAKILAKNPRQDIFENLYVFCWNFVKIV